MLGGHAGRIDVQPAGFNSQFRESEPPKAGLNQFSQKKVLVQVFIAVYRENSQLGHKPA